MKTETNIKYYSPILEEATAAITPQERAAFDLNFDISERIYQIIQKKGMTKREAFLKAQRTLKTTAGFENPRFWAAFIMLDGNEK